MSQVQSLFQRRRRSSSSYKPSFASRGSSSTTDSVHGNSTDVLQPRLDGVIRRSNSSVEIYEHPIQPPTRTHSASVNNLSYTPNTQARGSIENLQQVGSRAGIACSSETDLEQLKEAREAAHNRPKRRYGEQESSPSRVQSARFSDTQASPMHSPTLRGVEFAPEFARTGRVVSVDPPSHMTRTVGMTTSQESNSSSGLGGMSSASSPSLDRLLSPPAQANGSLSSSMSSISTSSNNSLDAVGTGGKRVVFGFQHERPKLLKDAPTVKEARQVFRMSM